MRILEETMADEATLKLGPIPLSLSNKVTVTVPSSFQSSGT